jgi:hypothetical protein
MLSAMIGKSFLKSTTIHGRQMSVLATVLRYSEYGDPGTVVQKCEEQIPDPKAHEILVKTLAAPINPADINTIQGKIDLFQILSFVTLLFFKENTRSNPPYLQFQATNVSQR